MLKFKKVINIKILGIAPYKGLKDLMLKLAEDHNELDIHVEIGDLQEGVELAKEAERRGYSLIISRGGTSSLIRKAVSLPVLEIKVTGYDLLRMLSLVKDYNGRIAIVGFPNITHGADTISSLLNIKIEKYTIYDESEVKEMLKKIQEKNIDVVLGDTITVKKAQDIGLHGILITSGKEAILEAFEDAKQMYTIISKMKKESLRYKNIMDNIVYGIVQISYTNNIEYYNKIFNNWMVTIIGENWVNKIENCELWTDILNIALSNKRDKLSDPYYLNYRNKHWAVRTVTQHGYTTIFLQAHNIIGEAKVQYLDIKHSNLSHPSHSFSQITGSSKLIKTEIEKAKKFSQLDVPIWIQGEPGTGKDLFAYSIHQASNYYKFPVISVDFKILTQKNQALNFLSDKLNEILNTVDHGTLYLKSIDELAPETQLKLFNLLSTTEEVFDNFKIISSSSLMMQRILGEQFNEKLYYTLAKAKIDLPPLRKRKEDIEDLSRLFIAKYNPKYGKQVVNLEEDLVEELKQLNWKGNVEQLENVIEEAVIITDGLSITYDSFLPILERLQQQETNSHQHNINLNGSLKEIENQIIHKVMLEENMNKTKVAERLGINRSTLWRKINGS